VTRTQALNAERRRGARKTGAPAAASREDIPERLDWQAFSAAYFPGRRRHDFEALIAYGAYRHARIVDEPLSTDADRLAEAKSDAWGAPALQAWEDEGGAAP
jgi:hypothetical protein